MNIENLIFNQTEYIIFALDPEARFIALNDAAEKLFSKTANTLIGQPITIVLDSYSHKKAINMVTTTLETGKVFDWELDHTQPDREPILVGYTTCLLHDTENNLVGIGAVGRDLTDKLELTAQLAATNQKLEGALLQLEKAHAELKRTQAQLQSEKMRALGQMVAGVAHEINNPLGFVKNNNIFFEEKIAMLEALVNEYSKLKMLVKADQLHSIIQFEKQSGLEYLWDDLKDAAHESLIGIQRIQKIVQSLRNFSRLDEAAFKEVDLTEGLSSTVNMVTPMCKEKITIHENYGDIPKIFCHPGEINQVFLNLLTNSIQAIDNEGSISITTSCQNDLLTVKIEDTGVGMDQLTLSKLGEPFFTTKPVGTGVGLGLSVSYGIIQRHQGKIIFESKLGFGTTATIELPVNYEKDGT